MDVRTDLPARGQGVTGGDALVANSKVEFADGDADQHGLCEQERAKERTPLSNAPTGQPFGQTVGVERDHALYAGKKEQTRGEIENPCCGNPRPRSASGVQSHGGDDRQSLQQEERGLVALNAAECDAKYIFMSEC